MLAARERAWHRARRLCPIVKERRPLAEPSHPPAEHHRRAAAESSQGRWTWCARCERPDGRAFVTAAERWAQNFVAGPIAARVVHEGMNHADDREARAGGSVGNRSVATCGVPAQDLVGELETPHGVCARSKPHSPGRHLEDVRSAGRVEHVPPIEEMSKRLAILAIAEQTRRNPVDEDTWLATPLMCPHRQRSGTFKGYFSAFVMALATLQPASYGDWAKLGDDLIGSRAAP